MLAEQYPLDRNDVRVNRVRELVYRLTEQNNSHQDPWHVHVFADDSFKNAAATRGNYIFVWSGIINDVQDDHELAAILAHEIGHVLAGHTNADPALEAREMMAGAAGSVTEQALMATGQNSIIAGIAEAAVKLSMQALLVNPEKQDKELEADHIGLFLMADAGFDPTKAVEFWERVADQPEYAGAPLEFLSSHPSSSTRYEELKKLLPDAIRRYNLRSGRADFISSADPSLQTPSSSPQGASRQTSRRRSPEIWVLVEDSVPVYKSPDPQSPAIAQHRIGTKIEVIGRAADYLEISSPSAGFIRGSDASPFQSGNSREDFTH
jgi:predicted Zn-dependent protease